jgi:hypothetical protein
MPGIGSTGLYVDALENEYAAQIVGRSRATELVWRDATGAKIATPESPETAPKGATFKRELVETGNFEIVGTFRDGTTKLFSDVPPASIFEPEKAPAPAHEAAAAE